jgi:WXG100 family type VII secretion target
MRTTMTLDVDPTAFRRGLADVRTAVHRLDTDRTDIDAKVAGFLHSGWTGVAADSFVEAWEEWKAAAQDVRDGLEAIGELLDAAYADLLEQDEESRAQLDSVAALIVDRLDG